MQLLRDFKSIDKNDVALAGGKGASLGEMTQAGISVPSGFVILSTAFEKFLEETDLNVEIDAAFNSVNHKEIHTVENAAEKIQALILQAEMPQDIEVEIQKFFKNLDSKYVAVRSSATAEDSASAAWAGQLDSYLNTTEETLLENVKKCWASLFTPRAIFYRFEKDLHKQKISVAVVVQKMVESEKSGVAFSVHPVTQDHNQIIIEAGLGLGEAIVSGQITPDSYVVEKGSRRIIDVNVNIQTRGLCRAVYGGNEWRDISKEQGEKQVLSDKEILELSEIILSIENHYGFPCDIEWAFEKGTFYIVQSRPITTLMGKISEAKSETSGSDPVQKFINLMDGRKLWPPLNNYTFFGQGSAFNTSKYFEDYYPNLPPLHLILIAKEGESMQMLPSDTLEYCSRYIFKSYLTGSKEAKHRFNDFDEVEKYISAMYEKHTKEKISKVSVNELLEIMDGIRDKIWHLNCYIMFTLYFDKEICLDVLKNTNSSVSAERLNSIWDKATHPAVESFEKAQRRSVLKTISEGKSREFIIENARFIFTNYFGAEKLEDVAKKIDHEYGSIAKEQADLELNKLDEELRVEKEKFNDWFQALPKDEQNLVWYLQRIIEYRDRRKNLFAKSYVIWWLIYEKVLSEAGIEPSSIIYIQFDEIMRGVEYLKSHNADIEARKNGAVLLIEFDGATTIQPLDYNKAKQRLTEFYVQSTTSGHKENEIKGQIGSPGKIKGRVRIVLNANKAEHFEDGDILVTGMTRPEFVHLMKRSSAVVTDEGGITCHAAIISRELKIPCVIGTKIATHKLKDGDFVEVDADNGVVRVIEESKSHITQDVPDTTLQEKNTLPNILDILGVKWQMGVTRNMSFLHQCLSMAGHFYDSQEFGVNINQVHIALTEHGTHTSIFTDPDNMVMYVKATLGTTDTPKKVAILKSKYERFAKDLFDALDTLDKKQDKGAWIDFSKKYQRMCAGLFITTIIGRAGGDLLAKKLKENGVDEQSIPDVIGLITYPDEHTPLFNSQLDLLVIVSDYQKEKISSKELEKHLNSWLDKYGYIPVNFCDEPWSIQDIKSQFESLLAKDCAKEVKRYITDHENRIKHKEEKLQELNLTEISNIAYAIAEGTYLNEFRKSVFSKVSLGYRNFFKKVAEQTQSKNWRDCFYLLPGEITEILDGKKFDIEKIKKDRDIIAYYINKNKQFTILNQDELEAITAFVAHGRGESSKNKQPQVNAQNQIKGYSANRGVVKGTARIILSSKDFNRLQSGEILVTTMTSVDFVPVMERAGAFVTNEGGITSHASIVAREMNKPCIIGTQNATQIIKDGDLVEVDADNGVVKIIEKNK